MKIGILVAMDKEYKMLQGLNNDNIIVRKTGIGKVNAAVNATQMIRDCHPDIIISSGCAGGATEKLDVMDVVVGTHYVYHDVYCKLNDEDYGQIQGMPLYFDAPDNLVQIAKNLEYTHNIHAGLIASGDWFVDSLNKIQEITDRFPETIAIDMESAAIAQTCHIFNVPFMSFRVISDVPVKGDNFACYNNFWDTVSENSFTVVHQLISKIQLEGL